MWKLKLIFIFGFIIQCTIAGQSCQTLIGQMGGNSQNGPNITEVKTTKLSFAVWPVWDDQTQSLYWVDFLATSSQPAIYRYDDRSGMTYSATVPGSQTIGFIYPVRQGCKECTNLFAVGSGHDVLLVKWDGISPQAQIVRTLFSVEPDNPLTHVNLARADGHGRLFEGPFSLEFCGAPVADQSLYRYDSSRGLQRIFTGVRATTGIAFDDKAHKMYHVGGCSLLLTEYDYDPKTGDVCNGRVVIDFNALGKTSDSFTPIGLDIDTNGLLYLTDYRSDLYVIDPRMRRVLKIIDIGVKALTGVAFGGKNRKTLFLLASSTIANVLNFQPLETVPDGSSLYKVTGLCATGRKSTSFKIPTACNGC